MLILLAFLTIYGILLPPPECDHEPTIPYFVIEYPLNEIPDKCQRSGSLILACTYYKKSPPEIIMPKIDNLLIPKGLYDVLLRHEKGHVNCGRWHEEAF